MGARTEGLAQSIENHPQSDYGEVRSEKQQHKGDDIESEAYKQLVLLTVEVRQDGTRHLEEIGKGRPYRNEHAYLKQIIAKGIQIDKQVGFEESGILEKPIQTEFLYLSIFKNRRSIHDRIILLWIKCNNLLSFGLRTY